MENCSLLPVPGLSPQLALPDTGCLPSGLLLRVCEAPAWCTWESPTTVENNFILPHLCPFSPGLGAWRGGRSRRVLTGVRKQKSAELFLRALPNDSCSGQHPWDRQQGAPRSSAEGNTPLPWTAESWEISTPFLVLDEQVNRTFILVTKKPNPFKKHTDPVLLVCVPLSQYPQCSDLLPSASVR